MALLAAFAVRDDRDTTLPEFLDTIFASSVGQAVGPDPDDVAGFEEFYSRYREGLSIERAAVEAQVRQNLTVSVDGFADEIRSRVSVVTVPEAGAEPFDLEVAGIEQEADEGLFVVGIAADVGHDDDAGFGGGGGGGECERQDGGDNCQ